VVNGNEGEDLILKIREWKQISIVSTRQNKDLFNIILREKVPTFSRKYVRRIIVSLSQKMQSYSIASFEINKNGDAKEDYIPLYSTEVLGSMETDKILTDLKAILNGKDEQIFGSKSSFDLKL